MKESSKGRFFEKTKGPQPLINDGTNDVAVGRTVLGTLGLSKRDTKYRSIIPSEGE